MQFPTLHRSLVSRLMAAVQEMSSLIWSGAAGGLLSLGLDYAIRFGIWTTTSPKLEIDYRDKQTGYRLFTGATTKAKKEGSDDEVEVNFKAMFINISVENTRKQTAKSCRGFLVGVDIVENGQFIATDYCDCIPLAWSYRSERDAHLGIDIPKGVVQFLNVLSCAEPKMGSGFLPCTVPGTRRAAATTHFNKPGEFRFRMQIAADNLNTKLFGLRVRWSGSWEDVWAGNCEAFSVMQDNSVYDYPIQRH
jgi:hypothetical protein